ncbi:MAG: peptidase domain protein [Alphaproteobacteria bacterium]|jgi:zinc protease|nr:peptidase domain protein [Alphaproteobacteria bacterium]
MMMAPDDIFGPCLLKRHPSRKHSFFKGSLPFGPSFLTALALGCAPSLGDQAPGTPSSAIKPQPSHINVQAVKSNKGITAWVVEAHDIPVVSVVIAFKNAGTAADPKGLAGLVQLLSGMLDEGAGEWDSQGFKNFLLKKNIELGISASQDVFQISFRTIKENVGEAFRVLNTLLSKPRFDDVSLARVKNQILSVLQQSLHNEHTLASQKLNARIYGDHPYGKPIQQTLKEFSKVTDDQLRQFMVNRFGRDQLLVSIVGDITAHETKDYLDKTFGNLPEKATPTDIIDAKLLNIGTIAIETLNIPQSLVYFTQPGIPRTHPDFYAAFVLMKIMGDGQFESRLWNEIREKRGLAYGIDADLNWLQHASLLLGGTATKNTSAKDVIDIIRNVWKEMSEGATQAELDFVKKRMIGSFALNFSSTIKIAKALLMYQIDNLGLNYINKRNEIIAALTLDDVNKVAKSLLKPEQLTFVIVGQPQGIPSPEPVEEKKPGANK